mgnify:CR=1 FL=1
MDSRSEALRQEIVLSDDSKICSVRISSELMRTLDRMLYRRYPEGEWGSFFRIGYRETPWGIAATIVDLLDPVEGDFDPESHVMEFQPAYIGRALEDSEAHEFGMGFIHSHPEDCPPRPSPSDNDMDRYFAEEFERYTNGRPYLSLIVSRNSNGEKTFSGRCFHKGKWLDVTEWRATGVSQISKFDHYKRREDVSLTDETERASELLGEMAIKRLKKSTIGIVGCSGLGTPSAEVLVRAGVSKFVLIDPGKFKPSNLERNHASRHEDLTAKNLRKVDLLERLILEINPKAIVIKICGDVLAPESIDELVRCDLVLSCTDSFYARAALGDLAIHYLVPFLDLAVQMGAKDGRLTDQVGEVAKYATDLPCPWCRNRVSAAGIKAEMATDAERERAIKDALAAEERGDDGQQYWTGQQHQELTVGYMTTAVGALGAGYAQHWITGVAEQPHARFQFDVGSAFFGIAEDDTEANPECTCVRCRGFSDQGSADFKVFQPEPTI